MSASHARNRASVIGVFVLLLFFALDLQARSLPDFTEMVEKYGPAVANISTKQFRSKKMELPHGLQIPDIPEDSPYYDFFRYFFDGPQGGPHGQETQSLGSGFIISKDGYLLTNFHVIDGADEVLVRLSDHREFVAQVVGKDKRSDIALLKIEAEDLPIVKVPQDKELKVGEWVVAIGSPFGFEHSVTAGIVSAKGRSLPSENYVPFIQTDVAINPGNSGGPLFNMDGEVVGVNSQIYSRTGGFMGLSFAIPIDVAMNVAEQLKGKGYVTRGWLGVLIQDVTRDLAESFGLPHPRGALVAKVVPDSPAEKGGIQAGDVILTFNGEEVDSSSTLPPLVGISPVDKPAAVEVLRQGERRTLSVIIAELPEDEAQAKEILAPGTVRGSLIGVTVRDLSAEEKTHLNLEHDAGVLVEEVREGPARDAGIRNGDVIHMINNVTLKSTEDFQQQLAALPRGKTVAVLIYRRSGPMFLALKVPDND